MDIVCWWSGGVTSAVACKLAIDLYGKDRCRIIFIDTQNEDEDTYRFKEDCQKWYQVPIETITRIGEDYKSIHDCWDKYKSLNVANGAICSTILKREVRQKWEKENSYAHQVFGFEFNKKEFNRAMGLKLNYPQTKPLFPLLMLGYDKERCLELLVPDAPRAYKMGFQNNNCLKTGCVQGGIGYWKKMQQDLPDKFNKMAEVEHRLTDLKGKPVTMLKDQSKEARESGKKLVFLKKHPKYPDYKSIDDMEAREVKPLMECNGFCGVNDLNPVNTTEKEINYDMGI